MIIKGNVRFMHKKEGKRIQIETQKYNTESKNDA